MRLSLWMIANRLYPLELECHICEDPAITLQSARFAYATDCVRIVQYNKSALCIAGSDFISIPDMEANTAFEMVQSVFDFYNSWYDSIHEAIQDHDFERFMDLCHQVFGNPVVLLDGNCRVLAISACYPADSLDYEWEYMHRHGHPSIEAIRYMREKITGLNINKNSIQAFHFQDVPPKLSGLTSGIYNNNEMYGRLNVMEKNRPLNPGDKQLIKMISQWLRPALGASNQSETTYKNNHIFFGLLKGEGINQQEMYVQLRYEGWEEADEYQIFYIQDMEESSSGPKPVWKNTKIELSTLFPHSRILNTDSNYILICNNSRSQPASNALLSVLASRKDLRTGFGYTFTGIRNIIHSYRQALAAVSYGFLYHPEKRIYNFYTYAVYSLLESEELSQSVRDCQPDIMRLFERELEVKDGLYQSFSVYMKHDGSLTHAAAELYVHKNTLAYRIRKITESFSYPYDDIYTKNYMRLSVFVLDLARRRGIIPCLQGERPLEGK